MTAKEPRTQELLRRMHECKTAMIARGIYMKKVDLQHTDVAKTWAEFATRASQAAMDGTTTSSVWAP